MKRYSVTVSREVIVYALSREEAGTKALLEVSGGMPPATRPVKVIKVTRLSPVRQEARGPLVDNAPARETRR